MELFTLKPDKYLLDKNKPHAPDSLDTLNNERTVYHRDEMIEGYESLVWTERFSAAGDTRILLPATSDNLKLVKPGTFLNLNTSREIMIIESRSIEDGVITAVGKDALEVLFKGRGFAFYPYTYKISWTRDETFTNSPRKILRDIALFANWRYDRLSTYHRIPGMRIGGVTDLPEDLFVTETIKYGDAYETLVKMAKKYTLGIGVYLTTNNVNGHDLVFRSHAGKDLTKEILFSPALDNFANVKELFSDAEYKNLVLALPPKVFDNTSLYIEPILLNNIALDRKFPGPPGPPEQYILKRILELENEDITDATLGGAGTNVETKKDKLRAILRKRGKAKLKELNRDNILDGEVTTEAQYKYIRQPNPNNDPVYRLGDKVQIGGTYTKPMVGIITEFTQSDDATGSRNYPTVVAEAEFYDSTHEDNSYGGQ